MIFSVQKILRFLITYHISCIKFILVPYSKLIQQLLSLFVRSFLASPYELAFRPSLGKKDVVLDGNLLLIMKMSSTIGKFSFCFLF